MSKRFRWVLLIVLIVLSFVSLYPTINWYFLLSDDVKQLASQSRESIRDYSFEKADEDVKTIVGMINSEEKNESSLQMQTSSEGVAYISDVAENRAKEINEPLTQDASAQEVLSQFDNKNDVFDTLVSFYREKIIALKNQKSRIVNLGLDISGGTSITLAVDQEDLAKRLGKSPSSQELADAINRAILVLQSRIDRFGVSEPKIRRQDNTNILIEIPGDVDNERINSFIRGKETMSFRIVNDKATQELINMQTVNPGWIYDPNNVPDFIPAGTVIMPYVSRDEFGLDKHRRWIAVYEDADTYGISGEKLEEAKVSADPLTNRPLVQFQMNSEGAEKLAKITSDNINQSMAIVLGDKVRAYATISSVISNGQAVIQGFSQEESTNIATILQTAVLPVVLNVINQEVVGPTLGKFVIQTGLKAITVGFILVVIFMVCYYKGAGLISVVSLLFNLLFLSAILASFSFTITLTGIAGIILTVGMAVDANVLIYERIKEELLLGKSRNAAIQNGFKKAFLTILDANVTTFIAAFFIAQIASGPIQGFAVTLSAGIITTLISALFVSRLFFDFFSDVFKPERISITWRRIQA